MGHWESWDEKIGEYWKEEVIGILRWKLKSKG